MKKFSYFLTLILMLGISEIVFSQCVTSYTSFSAGDFADGANWIGGIAPPNPIPPGVTVTMGHEMSNSGTIENNGAIIASVGSFTNNNGATFRGTGTFNGNFINNGTVSPGSTMTLPQLVTDPVTSITAISATSGGSICYDGGAAVTARGVCYSTSPNPNITNSITSNGSGSGTYTSNLTGLTPVTRYYARAYATNSVGTAYGNQVTFITSTVVVEVTNPITGRIWMDRNLGASQAATSSTDAASYGDLYQWGRGADGHQIRTSSTTSILSNTDQPGHGDFILNPTLPSDWRSNMNDNLWQGVNGVNNPCPSGYRVPTEMELNNERLSWVQAPISSTNDAAGAFASPLKLPVAGARDASSGSLYNVGTSGDYWSSTVSGTNARGLNFLSSNANMFTDYRADGYSVRCIKDGTLPTVTTTSASAINPTTANTGGNVTAEGSSAVTARGVCWSTSPNPNITNSITSNGSGAGTYTSNLTGLTPVTRYYARAYATNSAGTAYGNQVTFITSTVVVEVTNPITGRIWMDRNLGANQAATSSNDAASYGDIYQWGRGADGHQVRTSPTTSTLSNTDQPGHGDFILNPTSPSDWRLTVNDNLWQGVNGVNNPCPSGFRLPTIIEFNDERATWSSQNATGAFTSQIKLPMAGARNFTDGVVTNEGNFGIYWTSSITGDNIFPSWSLVFTPTNAGNFSSVRARGRSVRCIKN